MGIYNRGGVKWGRVQRGGVEHRKSLKTSSQEIARRRYRQWLDDLDAIEWGEKPRRLFDDAAERFVNEHLPNLKPSSARRYGVSLDWLADRFEGVYLDQITSSKLLEFEQARRAAGRPPPTIRRDLACLSSIFGMCIEWEWCEANPVPAFMRRRKRRGLKEAPPRTRYLSHDEEAALLASCSRHVREAAILAIDTGLRRGELFGLTWPRVDLNAGLISLSGATKSGAPREVPILERSAQILAQLPRHIRSPYVLHHRNGAPYVQMQRGFQAAIRRAGLKHLKWHDLRRTCGCRLLQDRGASMETVSEWLGHSSIVVTERTYAFIKIEDLQRAAQKSAQGTRIARETS